jgi:hypothetical protein
MTFRDEKAAMRRRRPVSAATRAAFDEAATYFPTALQQFQFFDKYSRFNYALGRRETWVETVDRAVDFLVELTEATTGQRRGEVVEWLRGDGREMMLRMEALPSMRLLAMAGEPVRRQNLALFNCSYISVDDPQAWVEMLIISMSGCGVGFSVERKYIDKLPLVAMQTGRYIDHIVVDSTEGWAEALRLGLKSWFVDGVDVQYDFSQVRPAGAPLKTKGGRASGPDPLRIMLLSIRNIILSRQGQRLRDTDAHTISCHVGQAAVQGGMRRTAMISLSDADSTDMARIKQGNYDPVLWNANNSSVWHGGVDDLTILRHFVEMDEGKNGERGIFSRDAAMATMPERRRALWPQGVDAGTNPCIVGDTLVYLADGRGHVSIKQLAEEGVDIPVFCIDRRGFLTVRTMRNPRVTGYQVPVLKVTLDDGSSLTVTPNHKFCTSEGAWVAANSLKLGDSIGTLVKSLDGLSFGATRQSPEQNFIAASRALRQGYDAELVGGVWVLNKRCEKCDNVFKTPLTMREVGFCSQQCWENRGVTEKFNCETAIRVVAVDAAGVADVYNGTVDEFHNFFVGGFPLPDGKGYVYVNNLQCGEIVLRSSGQLCNLSIAVARTDDTIASLSRKVKAAAIFGTVQATATNFPGLRPVWKENCDAERLLGVDINGQLDCPLFAKGPNSRLTAAVYAAMRLAAVEQNNQTAAALGINASTAVTCVKPSGNSSTLLDCSPGLHPRHAAYYIRNVRVSSHSPVYKVLRDAGAPLSPENGQTAETATTWVCSFPCKAPDGATVKADETAIDQLERWLLCKRWYTEHNASVTVTYKPHELVEVAAWVAKHRDVVGGLSFLPYSGAAYEQMPYVEISREEYEARAAAFPVIDWSKLVYYEDRDLTTAAQELACAAGACLI